MHTSHFTEDLPTHVVVFTTVLYSLKMKSQNMLAWMFGLMWV